MKGYFLCFFTCLFFIFGSVSAQSPDSLFHIAQNEAYKNHYAEASQILVPLVKKYPTDIDYSIFYGTLYSWMHKYDSSKIILRHVIATNHKSLDAYDALTNTEIWSGDDSMAIIDCHKAMLIPKADKETYMLRIAEAKKDLRKYSTAARIVDSLLERNPKDTSAKSIQKDIYSILMQKSADSLFDTAEHLTYRRQYTVAEKIAKKITLQFPANADYKILWSTTLANMKKIDTSEIMLKEIISAEPGNLEAYDVLAEDELLATKYRRALLIADSAISMPVRGDRSTLIITRASAQNGLGDPYAGLITLDTLVKKHHNNTDAVDLYKALLLQIRQKVADSLFALAQHDADKKKYTDAEDLMDTITKWYPDNTDYQIYKGRVYCWEDNHKTNTQYGFQIVVFNSPFYRLDNKYDTGIAILTAVIKKHPHDLDAYDALTDAELLKKNYVLTITNCDKALADSVFKGYPSMRKQKKDTSFAALNPPVVPFMKDTTLKVTDTLKPVEVKDTAKTAKKDTVKTAKKDTTTLKNYTTFMLKRAQTLYYIPNYQGCVNTLDTLRKIDSTNKTANDLLTEAKIKLLKNSLQFGYLNNSFNAPPTGPWHYAWLQYMRNFTGCPVAVKATYGSIYGLPVGWRDGWQFGAEAFPKISSAAYGDASVAYSDDYSVFPKWQTTADIYQRLPGGFEISLGGIYMHFIDEIDSPATAPQDVWIFDPSISYYIGNAWQFTYKPYWAFERSASYIAHTATIRHFLGNEDSWVSLYGVIGTTPYVDFYFPSSIPTNVRSVGIDYQTRLPHNWLIWPMASYEYWEYYPGLWRNMYTIQIIITKRF